MMAKSMVKWKLLKFPPFPWAEQWQELIENVHESTSQQDWYKNSKQLLQSIG